jgi:Bacterial Ig domain/PKD domain/Calx-beta domain/Palmitoyl protein thioesterase
MISIARRLIVLLSLVAAAFAFTGQAAADPLSSLTLPPGCTITWDGGAGTARWHDAANWDTNVVPGPADRVCIPAGAPGAVVLLGDPTGTAVAALHSEKPVNVAAGQLTLAGSSAVDALRLTGGVVDAAELAVATELTQTGGELTGAGTVSVEGVMVWTAGAQSGNGMTDVVGAGGLRLDGEGTRTIRGPRLVTSATDVTWTGEGELVLEGGHIQALQRFVSSSPFATVTGAGAVHVSEQLLVTGILGLHVPLDAAGATAIVDGAAAQLALRVGGEHVTRFDLRNSGSVFFDGSAHTLVADVVASNGGGVVANAPVTVEGDFQSEATRVNGEGVLTLLGAAQLGKTEIVGGGVLEAAGDTAVSTLTQSGGELRGAGTVRVDGAYTWSRGSQSGTGTTEVNGGNLILAGDGERTLGGDRLLVANPGVSWTGGGDLELAGSTLQTNGPFVASGASAELFGDGTLNLGGDLVVQGGYFGLDADFQAASHWIRVVGENAALGMGVGEHIANIRLEGGSLMTEDGVHTFVGPVTGNGVFVSDGDVTLETELSTDRVTVAEGRLKLPPETSVRKLSIWDTATLETTAAATIAEIVQEGDVHGPGALTVTGAYKWLGGVQSGPGSTTIAGTAGELEIAGAAGGARTLDRVLRVERNARFGGGAELSTAPGAELRIVGDALVDGGFFVGGDGGVVVDGSLRVQGAEAGIATDMKTRPGSSLEVAGQNGLLSLAHDAHFEGDVAVSTGGHLELIDGTHTFDVESDVDAMAGGYVSTDEDTELVVRGAFDAEELWLLGAKAVVDAPVVNVTRLLTHAELDIEPGASLVTHESFENLEGTVTLRGTGAVLEGRGELENAQTGVIGGLGTIRGRLVNHGRLEPGLEGRNGVLRVDGTLELSDDSAVEIQASAAAHDELAVTGTALLDGLVTVSLADDVDEVTVVRPFARVGEFDAAAGSNCAAVRYDGAHVLASNLPCVLVADAQVQERGGKLRFPVTVSRSSGQAVSVSWETEAGTATPGEDFQAANGVLILGAGQTSSAIELPVLDDDEEEEAVETMTLRLTGVDGARLRTQQVTGTIHDDDGDNAEPDLWYKPRDVGRIGMQMTPTAMSHRSVVGYTENQVDWTYWKFAWGYRIDLDQLSSVPPLGAALDLNRHGTLAGNTDVDEETASKPVLRRNGPVLVELPEPSGYSGAYAFGLNDDEWVVGEASRPTAGNQLGGSDAIMWQPDGSTVVLESAAGSGFAVGVDVNNRGQAIGYTSVNGGRAAWIWENGSLQDIGSLGAYTTPSRVNEHGEVVGVSGSGQVGRAFVWKPGIGLIDLGAGAAEDINEKHEIVGIADGLGAALWKADGTRVNLNTLLPPNSGWFLTIANAINDDGKISGWGYKDGNRAVFVLEPKDCKICVEEAKTEHLTYSGSSYVETDKTTDGNKVRIKAEIVNEGYEPKDVAIRIVDADTDEQLGEDIEGFRLEPGESREIETVWDTTGSAWRGDDPRRARTIRIEAVSPEGDPLDDEEKELGIAPRPVVMVHGLWSDASTWAGYTQLLQAVNPDWYGFAVGTMDTESGTIAANAAEVAQAVENVRVAREAWHVDLVAHSTGGLIARRYVHELMQPLADGTPPVASLVMLGTPNHGSPCADLVPLESTFEMRTDVVRGFNAAVTERRGVDFSVAAGERTHVTCDMPLPGDDVVPVASARTGYDDSAVFQVAHVAMTNSDALFHQFVKPHLSRAPAGPAGLRSAFAATVASAAAGDPIERPQPQLLDSRTLSIGAGASVELPLSAGSGSGVGAVLAAPGSVSSTLRDVFGDPVDAFEASGGAGLAFRTVRGSAEASSQFRLEVRNEGAEPVQVPFSAWVEDPATRLEANAVQSSPAGRVRVTAQVLGSPRPAITAELRRTGMQPVTLTLLDDGLSGDGAKADGVYSNRTNALENGDYTVVVRAASPLNRLTTAAVRVLRADPPPPNVPPVPATPAVEGKANGAVTFTLDATDADDDPLEIVRAGNPAHGSVSGTGRTLTYTPHTDYVGADLLPYRVSDGVNAPVLANVEIAVTRRPALLVYDGPNEVREGTTAHLRTQLVDSQFTGRGISGGNVSYELDGVALPVDAGGFGIYNSDFQVGAGLRTMTLVARFPGNALHAPTEMSAQIVVKANRAPAVVPATAGIDGEAGYTTRFHASPSDPDGNLETIEFDYTGDGVYDVSYRIDDPFAEWITVYPEAFEGNARVRVTDRLGLQATAALAMHVAPHRPLGPLSRILVDGRRVDGGQTSEDGRFVLFDHERNDFPPTGKPNELFVLDTATGEDERVGIFPDGQIARDHSRTADRARISATGRWVAFALTTKAGDAGIEGQVYLRDREAQTTEIVSVNSSEQLANKWSIPVAISPDGRYVLLHSAATNLDPRTTSGCPGCENLYLRDREAGTTELVSIGFDGKPVGNQYLTGGMSADGRHVVFASGWKAVAEKTTTHPDIFVRDLELDRTARVSVPTGGGEANARSDLGHLGDRGRYVIFSSDATNLVPGDTNGKTDVFRHDRDADADGAFDEPGATSTVRVSVGAGGVEPNNSAAFAIANCDGSVVTFWSTASNLVPGDANGAADVFVRDVRAGTTTRISVDPRDGVEPNSDSTWAKAISPDGRYVYFPSDASNLVPGDVNGLRDYFVHDRGTSVDCWEGGANEAPVAVDDAYEVDEDAQLVFPAPGVLANDTDADGDLLYAEVVEGPEHGVLTLLEDGALAYTPEPDFNGEDELTYVATDGADESEPATVTIEVTPVNDAPVAADSSLATDEDVPVEPAFDGSDPDDLPGSEEPTALEPVVVGGPEHGTLADGVYTPQADWSGTDTIEFRLSDGELESEPAVLTIEVAPVNDAPVATDGAAATDEDAAVELPLAGTDVDGDALAFELVEQPEHGSVGGAAYTPAANWHGVDTVRFRVSDGSASDEAVVTVTVSPLNDAPDAHDASIATDEDTAVELAFDATDVDGDDLVYELVDQPAHGSVSGETYTPAANWNGTETLRFRASDGQMSDDAVLTIAVRPANDAPVATGGSAATDEDVAVDLPFAGADVDGDALAYEVVEQPAHGSVTGRSYRPAPNWHGAETVRFRASDGASSDEAAVTVTVRPVNDAPTVAIAPAGPVDEGAPAIPVTATATDVDGDAVTYSWSADAGVVSGTGASAAFRAEDGPRTARVRVVVSDGRASGSDETSVEVRNVAPSIVAGPAAAGPWGVALELGATATDPSAADRASLAAAWAFGDGTSGSGLATAHAYAEPGSYAATVTVSDKDGGSRAADVPVTVRKRATAVQLTLAASSSPTETAFAVRLADSVDASSARLAGREVVVEVGGQTLRGAVDASGAAVVRPASPLAPGTYAVAARFAEDALYLASQTSVQIVVGATPGKVTGGGLRTGGDGRGGFVVQSDGRQVKGELQWQSAGVSLHAHELTGLAISSDRRRARFEGIATDGRRFVAEVEDGRPDRFSLWIEGVLVTPGSGLTGGSIQIHKG